MSVYLSVAEVKTLHLAVLALFGGADGIRDLDALEAAVNRPQNGYYADLTEEAAALLESLLINHPFVDGNKRTAFAACDVFLRLNGRRIVGNADLLHPHIMDWIAAAPTERFHRIREDLPRFLCALA
jgi:death-on-curing protein